MTRLRPLQAGVVLLLLALGTATPCRSDSPPLAEEQAQARAVTEEIPWAELLGPLAPVALSPFFGITCLSGCALLAERGLLPQNQFFQQSDALRNPAVFAVFLCLTLLTSLPRLSKVSKPLAQAADVLETYAGLVTMVALHYVARHGEANTALAAAPLAAGFAAQGGDLLLAAVSAANVLVIHSVRFFFEMLVWLSPVPLLDALFEFANKAMCAGLVFVYALHPAAALTLNTILFLGCLCLLRWSRRKTIFYREIFLGPLWHRVAGRFGFSSVPPWPAPLPGRRTDRDGGEGRGGLPVFPSQRVAAIPRHARCLLVQGSEGLWLVEPRWLRAARKERLSVGQGRARISWLYGTAVFEGSRLRLLFSARYAPCLPEIRRAFIWAEAGADEPGLPSSLREMARGLARAGRETRDDPAPPATASPA